MRTDLLHRLAELALGKRRLSALDAEVGTDLGPVAASIPKAHERPGDGAELLALLVAQAGPGAGHKAAIVLLGSVGHVEDADRAALTEAFQGAHDDILLILATHAQEDIL